MDQLMYNQFIPIQLRVALQNGLFKVIKKLK